MNLRPKLMLAFILLIIIPMIGLGIFSFVNSERLLEKKYSEQTEISLRAVGAISGISFESWTSSPTAI